MMTKLLLKKILPTVVGVALLVLAGLWLYGYVGVKAGWVGVGDYSSLNAISQHGADTAGGLTAIGKKAVGL
ncbi:MAG: hypothetical protein IKO01_02270 [Kiritimatiellae bacterium]|nr:hypothetical protein [Kiritimatiellia bacterium]MBR4190362.1 hypothetical protein [Kiritimatiellia bacterium]MBR4251395.1 hypothetical protein [Kiritimatiellia bacterium]MBR4253451.1 hypothetical protein [Kiritimatiellia bacterium]